MTKGRGDVNKFIKSLDNPFADYEASEPASVRDPTADISEDPRQQNRETQPPSVEIVIDAKRGRPRQAGADLAEGKFITEFRQSAEQSLYVFTKGILNRNYLSPALHISMSKWASAIPPFRKLILIPRKHAKTSMISHGLPPHMIIQPKDNNIYLPGRAGVDTRILLAGETEQRASNNLSTVEAA